MSAQLPEFVRRGTYVNSDGVGVEGGGGAETACGKAAGAEMNTGVEMNTGAEMNRRGNFWRGNEPSWKFLALK